MTSSRHLGKVTIIMLCEARKIFYPPLVQLGIYIFKWEKEHDILEGLILENLWGEDKIFPAYSVIEKSKYVTIWKT